MASVANAPRSGPRELARAVESGRRVGGGVHDDLSDDAPARVPRLTACDEEPSERIREDDAVRLRAVGVEMPESLGDAAPGSDGSRQLERCPPGPAP